MQTLKQKSRWKIRIVISTLVFAVAAGHAAATELLVPAYFDPNTNADLWAQMTAATSQVKVTAIFNPNSGPGTKVDNAYTSVLSNFRTAGGTAIAYIHTVNSDGTLRTLSEVEADFNKYRSFYTFDGVFVDEMKNDPSKTYEKFYKNFYNYIKSVDPSYLVVGNPGINIPQAYQAAADVFVTYEDVGANYAANVPDAWTQSKTISTTFSNMPYSVAAGDLQSTLAIAAGRNTKYIYVTDDGGANPYDTLPSYWAAEVQAVAAPEPAAGIAAVAIFLAGSRRRRSARLQSN